jgi:hypothetical protein
MRETKIGLEFSKTDATANGVNNRVIKNEPTGAAELKKVLRKHDRPKDEDNLMNRGDFKFFYSGRKLL